MNNRNIMLGAVLALLAFVLLYQFVLKSNPEMEADMANVEAQQQNTAPAATQQAAAQAAPGANNGTLQTAKVDPNELIKKIKVESFDYDNAREQRDPMRPLLGPDAPQQLAAAENGEATAQARQMDMSSVLRLRVTGIIHDDVRPLAVIDQQVVGAGDEIAPGVVVDAVESDRVLLRAQGTLIPLEINQ